MQLHPPARSRTSRSERGGDLVELKTHCDRRAAAATAFATWCRPVVKLHLRFRLTISPVMEREGVAPISVTYRFQAQTPSSSGWMVDQGSTWALVRLRIDQTSGSSMFNTAQPSGGGPYQLTLGAGDRGLSAELPQVGRPTFSTTPTRGGAMSQR